MLLPSKPHFLTLLLFVSVGVYAQVVDLNERVEQLNVSHAVEAVPGPQASSSQKIKFAKRILGLPEEAAPGTLWRTYMTRLYSLPIDATLDQMDKAHTRRDMRYWLMSEGLPEWCPYSLIPMKGNFEYGVMAPLFSKLAYRVSPFASEEELQKAVEEKTKKLSDQTLRAGKKKLEYEDLYAAQIIQSFWLPKNTTKDQAYAFQNRFVRFLGGACNQQEWDELHRREEREKALCVLRPIKRMSDEELFGKRRSIVEATKLETPDLETDLGRNRFY